MPRSLSKTRSNNANVIQTIASSSNPGCANGPDQSSKAPAGNNSDNNVNNSQGLLGLPGVSIQGSLTPEPDLLYHTDQHFPVPTAADPVTDYILNHDTAEKTLLASSYATDQEAVHKCTIDTRFPVLITSQGVNNSNPGLMDEPVQAISSSTLKLKTMKILKKTMKKPYN